MRLGRNKIGATVLGLIFLVTAALKLHAFFTGSLNSPSFPNSVVVAGGIVEIALGIGLIGPWFGYFVKPTFFWVLGLSGVSLGLQLRERSVHTCGCFGRVELPPIGHWILVLGLVVIALDLLLYENANLEKPI